MTPNERRARGAPLDRGAKVAVNREVGAEALAPLVPLADLSARARQELARSTMIERQPADRRLFVQGSTDNWTFYLLEGTVELRAADGSGRKVTGGTPEARTPLAPGRPRGATALSRTLVSYIRLDNDLLAVLLGENDVARYEVVELSAQDDVAENRLLNEIYYEFMAESLVLPAMPDIALRVRQAVQDSSKNIAAVAKIVQMDPGLAARLIQVANSPLYRGQTAIDDCKAAITRLGLTVTRNLVISFTLHGVFHSRLAMLNRRMSELWLHCSRVAALSYVLAARTPGIDPDRAMLAGLVHDIGVLPILSHIERYPDLLNNRAHLERTLTAFRGQLGAMVLRKWRFSSDLVTVALEAEDWYRDPTAGPDYCDVVLVAQLHSFFGTPQMAACPPLGEVPAFGKLARGRLDPQMSVNILEEAKDDIQQVLHLLRG
jgi:HD-like signal output (HDOD) protein